jgi:polysaccharide biosynthesis/export protein
MKSKYILINLVILVLLFMGSGIAQEDLQIGRTGNKLESLKGAQYDYSDPNSINIKVKVWGYVQFPGHYTVPAGSSINDIISLAGGPTPDADLEEMRIFRVASDSSQQMIKFDYNDLLWENELTKPVKMPGILAGDMILVPGSPRFFLRDYLSLTLSVVTTLASVAVLILTIK